MAEFILAKYLFFLLENDIQKPKEKSSRKTTLKRCGTPITESNQVENLIAGPCKSPRVHFENLDEIKSSLRKEIKPDLTKILAENQKEMLKLIAPASKTLDNHRNEGNIDSETETVPPTAKSTPMTTRTTTHNKPGTAKVGAISKAQNLKGGPFGFCETPAGCKNFFKK